MGNWRFKMASHLVNTVIVFNEIPNGQLFTSLDVLTEFCECGEFKKYSAEGKKAAKSIMMGLIKIEKAGCIEKAGFLRDGRNALIKLAPAELTADAKSIISNPIPGPTPSPQKPTKKGEGQLDANHW